MQSSRLVVEVLGGEADGKTFVFDRFPIFLGRHPQDDVHLPFDKTASRHHARILVDGNTFAVEDIGSEGRGSTNGTYLNEKQVFDKTALSSGDTLLLGNTLLRLGIEVCRGDEP